MTNGLARYYTPLCFWAWTPLSTGVIALTRYSKTFGERRVVQTRIIYVYTALGLGKE